jgi:hypothetical protein
MTAGWDDKNPLDMACRADSFHEFVRNVLDKFPGYYAKSLVRFIGEGKNKIDFIGKYENLVEDLIMALKFAGESFDENSIRILPPYNVSDKARFPAEYTAQLEQEVRNAEITVIRMYY